MSPERHFSQLKCLIKYMLVPQPEHLRYDVSMTTPAKHPIKLPTLAHHAYYLVGGDSVCAELVAALAKQHKIKIHGNPDFSERKYENFTIDDARELKVSAEMRPVSSDTAAVDAKKIFVIQMSNITSEAQNALLKLLEEPADYVHFFLIVASAHLLLPTVKSRMSFINEQSDIAVNTMGNDAMAFLKLLPAKRLEYIKKLVDAIADEKRPKQDAIDLINAIEAQIYAVSGARKSTKKLEAIEMVRNYMNDRGASIKMLLEYVALNI